MVKKQSNRSEIAKFTMNKFCGVRIRGFLATAKQTKPLPNAPININTA